MGQYYVIANLDKQQYLDPWTFGDGRKLLEFASSAGGAMTGLGLLLASGNGRGSGDLHSEHLVIGSWAGDRIAIVGDYDDGGKFLDGVAAEKLQEVANQAYTKGFNEAERVNLYAWITYSGEWEDISLQAISAMTEDEYLRHDLVERTKHTSDPELMKILKASLRKGQS